MFRTKVVENTKCVFYVQYTWSVNFDNLTEWTLLVRVHSRICKLPINNGLPNEMAETALKSESYVTTDGQPASLSWSKAPI
jgi:hypothetical protein